MTWFKHDTNASVDAKLQSLMLDYGAAGYGLYWYCVELIAQKVDKNNITFELEHDARIIAKNLNLSTEETINMMKKMVQLKLFSFTENNKLACYALAKRLDQSMTSNPEFRALINSVKESHDGVMINHDLVKSEEKRREEKRREEKRREESYIVEIENIISHLNQIANSSYRPTTKKTKDLITSKLKDGFVVEDFYKVHINKYADWINTDYEKFLRPETLYGNKFESYLNQKITDYEKMKAINSHTGLSALEMLKQQGFA